MPLALEEEDKNRDLILPSPPAKFAVISLSFLTTLTISYPGTSTNSNAKREEDVDIIVNSDICYLFEQKNNYVIAAVKEPGDKINLAQLNNNIGLAENNNYFNAGVMLMNCNKWRENNITQKIFNLYKNKPNLKYADQDLLNIYFENNCTLLPDKFNRVCLNDDTVIIHYTGATKPWHINPDNCSFEEVKLFWKYAKMTPFYDELYSKTLNGAEQKQKYMLYRIQRMAKSRFYEQ